jgi:hypothetical protein
VLGQKCRAEWSFRQQPPSVEDHRLFGSPRSSSHHRTVPAWHPLCTPTMTAVPAALARSADTNSVEAQHGKTRFTRYAA